MCFFRKKDREFYYLPKTFRGYPYIMYKYAGRSKTVPGMAIPSIKGRYFTPSSLRRIFSGKIITVKHFTDSGSRRNHGEIPYHPQGSHIR